MTATARASLVQCRSISKRFGGEVALEDVDFDLRPGEVHGLVGSNGAGKSTLMKILAGALPDHEGEILLRGEPVKLSSPQEALRLGIAMVYQELSGIGSLSVAENLFLGRQPTAPFGRIDWRSMHEKAAEYLRKLEIEVDVRRRLDRYPLVVRQMVEIARGVHSGADVQLLDEPTSALSPPETQRLFGLIAELRARGVAMVFVSHFIEDVLEICDRVTVLRDGRRVETVRAADVSKHHVIHSMLGRAQDKVAAGYEAGTQLPERTETPPVLRVEDLGREGGFREVTFEVSPGECLGLYGFVGAGHQEVTHAIAGATRAERGRVLLEGKPLKPGDPSGAIRQGVVLVGADRAQTLFLRAEVYKNVTLAHLREAVGGWLTRRRETRAARPVLERVGCVPPSPQLRTASLSGGNQQKVVVAKWLLGDVRVLVLEEPTRGMDVWAKEEIMRLVGELKQRGAAVVLASSEPELLLAHADRILVMSRGRVRREFAGEQVDKAMLMRYA